MCRKECIAEGNILSTINTWPEVMIWRRVCENLARTYWKKTMVKLRK